MSKPNHSRHRIHPCDETAAAVVQGKGHCWCECRRLIHGPNDARNGGVIPEIASRAHRPVLVRWYSKALADANMTIRRRRCHRRLGGSRLWPGSLAGRRFGGEGIGHGQPTKPILRHQHPSSGMWPSRQLQYGRPAGQIRWRSSSLSEDTPRYCMSTTSRVIVRGVVVGTTLDDAAGELFRLKVARLLDSHIPGGPYIDRPWPRHWWRSACHQGARKDSRKGRRGQGASVTMSASPG